MDRLRLPLKEIRLFTRETWKLLISSTRSTPFVQQSASSDQRTLISNLKTSSPISTPYQLTNYLRLLLSLPNLLQTTKSCLLIYLALPENLLLSLYNPSPLVPSYSFVKQDSSRRLLDSSIYRKFRLSAQIEGDPGLQLNEIRGINCGRRRRE